jgi:hypothetical protein
MGPPSPRTMQWPWKKKALKISRPDRKLVSLSASMRTPHGDGDWAQVHILNAAIGGLQLRADQVPSIGETIEVVHRGLTIQGRVVRVEGRRFAIEATEAINLEQLLAKSDLATRSAMTVNPGTGESPLHWSKRD